MEGMSQDHFSVIYLMLANQPLNSDNELTLFIYDALRFVSAFFIPISQCAPHVYISALPFTPEQSHIATKFSSRFSNTLAITQGKPSQWSMVVFIAKHHKEYVRDMVFSVDERTFASISRRTMYVCDSETGHCISGPFELLNHGEVYNACFSPDGKHILLVFSSYAVVWDIRMGEEQFRIEDYDFAFIHHDGRIASIHWIDEDGNFIQRIASDNSEHEDSTHLQVQFWDASNGTLLSDRLLEMNDIAVTNSSLDGHFLAIGRKSEDVIEL